MSQTPGLQGYQQWCDASPPGFKKELIRHFIEETLHYAREHIEMRENELKILKSEASGSPDIAHRQERLSRWHAYVEFQEHTLQELYGEKLDRFID